MFSRAFLILVVPTVLIAGFSGCFQKRQAEDAANQDPVAEMSITPESAPGLFLFNASASSDPDGDALTYSWRYGVGSGPNETFTANESSFRVQFDVGMKNYKLPVSLVVRDGRGGAGAAYQLLAFGTGNNSAPAAQIRAAPRWVPVGTDVGLDALPSVDPDGDSVKYEWIYGPRGYYDEKASASMSACQAQPDRTEQIFNSACFGREEPFTMTFNVTGTYDYHCHPHPWMKARLVVDPNSANTTPVEIAIRDFAYAPGDLVVGPGTRVTFVNEDPIPHTVTVEDYTPGTKSGGTGRAFLLEDLAAGDYVVRLIVKDPKGGRATASFGIRASEDSPEIPMNRHEESQPANPSVPVEAFLPTQTHSTEPFEADYPFLVDAVMTFTSDPGGGSWGNFSFNDVTGGQAPAIVNACVAARGSFDELSQSFMTCFLDLHGSGNFQFILAPEDGAVTDWSFDYTIIQYSLPGFGDSSGGHNHPL